MRIYLLGLLGFLFALTLAQHDPKDKKKGEGVVTYVPFKRPGSNQACVATDQGVGEGCSCGVGKPDCQPGLVCHWPTRDEKDTWNNSCKKAPAYVGEGLNCPHENECPKDYYCKKDNLDPKYNVCRLLCVNGACSCGLPDMPPCAFGQKCGPDNKCIAERVGKGSACGKGKPGCDSGLYCYMPYGKEEDTDVNKCTRTDPENPCSGGICHCGQQLRGCPDKSYCQMPGRNKLDIDRNTCKRNVPKQPQTFTGELGSSCGAGASVDCKQGLWCYLETGDLFDLANNTCISEDECCAHMSHSHEASPECQMCGMCVAPPTASAPKSKKPARRSLNIKHPRLTKDRTLSGPFLEQPNCYAYYFASAVRPEDI